MISVFYRPCGKTYQEQHTAAYELLDAAVSFLGHTMGRIEKTEHGKPFFPDRPNLFFSLSHTDGYAVCAVGDAPCGIDIEAKGEISEKIRNRFLGGASAEEAVLRWTERESYGKYEGRGFFAGKIPEGVRFVTYQSLDGFVVTLCIGAAGEAHGDLILR
jgi:phosphopantetheinyl transferase